MVSAPEPADRSAPPRIHELGAADVDWARDFLERVAGATRMVSRGRLHHCHRLPGFYAEREGRRIALLTYRIDAGDLEVVALYAEERGQGAGTALLEAARERAGELGCRRLWLVTTNDNEPAIGFYRNRGMRLAAVHEGAVDRARRELKREIPTHGVGGVAIHDEFELELRIEGRKGQ